MTRRLLFACAAAALLSAACFESFNTSTSPTATVNLFGGTWVSSNSPGTQLINSCTNFKWTVTSSTPTLAAGNFSATCFGTMQVTGSAQGVPNGSTVTWTATAVATGGGVNDCAISLSGTATLGADQITIAYTGTTCLGPVAGTEVLVKS
jgi:hypothetical protein